MWTGKAGGETGGKERGKGVEKGEESGVASNFQCRGLKDEVLKAPRNRAPIDTRIEARR